MARSFFGKIDEKNNHEITKKCCQQLSTRVQTQTISETLLEEADDKIFIHSFICINVLI